MKSSPETACSPQPIPAVVLAIAALAILLRVGMAAATHFTQEDFLITLRYAENIAHGRGFVFNVGERVLGTTTPLYALFLAAVAHVGLPAAAVGKTLNILADGALCIVLWRWLSLVRQDAAGRWAAFLVAVNPIQMRVAISGQESSLVALCGALVWLWYAERRYYAAYVASAFLFLLRWDGLLLIGVLTVAILARERRLMWRELAVFLLLCAPWLLFAALYFGSPIPVTLAAKTAVYGWYFRSERLPELSRLLYRVWGTPLYALMALAAALGVWRLVRERWTLFLPPVAWFALYWLAFLVSKVLLFEWYLVPPLFVYAMLAGLGMTTAFDYAGTRGPRPVRSLLAAGLAGCLCVLNVRDTFFYTRQLQGLEDNLRQPLGLWLRAHSRPTDRVMLEPIGYIGYYSRLPVVDMTGLVTPSVLPCYDRKNPCPWLSIAYQYQPDWCIVRPFESDLMRRVSATMGKPWGKSYTYVRSFSYAVRPQDPPAVFEVYHRN